MMEEAKGVHISPCHLEVLTLVPVAILCVVPLALAVLILESESLFWWLCLEASVCELTLLPRTWVRGTY